jgi:hypothetical protein
VGGIATLAGLPLGLGALALLIAAASLPRLEGKGASIARQTGLGS